MKNPSSTQPRGTNGHKPTEFSERTFTAPDSHSHLMPTGGITVLATNLLPGDTVFCRGADDALIELGDVQTVGQHALKPGHLIIHLHRGSIAARKKDVIKVHRLNAAPDYDPAADTDQVLRAAYHARTDLDTLVQMTAGAHPDEVLIAVAGHANASEEIIDLISRRASAQVQLAAISNPVTSTATLRRLHNAAIRAANEPEADVNVDVDTLVGEPPRTMSAFLKNREERRDRIAQAEVIRDAAHAALGRRIRTA